MVEEIRNRVKTLLKVRGGIHGVNAIQQQHHVLYAVVIDPVETGVVILTNTDGSMVASILRPVSC
jgi:hypothetical protein